MAHVVVVLKLGCCCECFCTAFSEYLSEPFWRHSGFEPKGIVLLIALDLKGTILAAYSFVGMLGIYQSVNSFIVDCLGR